MTHVQRATPMEFSPDGRTLDKYWVLGNPHKPPLLFIPGFTGTHSDLLDVAEFLENDYHIIIPEMPGWGESERLGGKLTIHNYAKYLKKLLETIEVKNVTVVGHCMGATVAIELVYLYPHLAKNIILVSTPFRKGQMTQSLFLHLADMSVHAPQPLKPLFYFWRSRTLSIPVSFFTLKFRSTRKKLHSLHHLFTYQPTEPEESVEECWTSLMHFNYNKIKKIKVPIHFIHGEKDMLVNKDHAIKLFSMAQGATIDFIPDAGHIPPSETPQSLATLILKYK